MMSGAPETPVLLGTSGGNALRAKLESFVTRIRAGKQFVSVDEGESLLEPAVIPAEATEVAALSGEGRLLVFPLEEVKELPSGGKGVMAMKLHEGESMLGVRAVKDPIEIAARGRGDKAITITIDAKSIDHYRGARARTGRVLQPYFKHVENFTTSTPA
jgi:topoisomerase IV subunit A